MSYDEKAAERVRRALASEKGLVERQMIGGICFMVHGNMCCGVSGSALMIRVGQDAYEAMLAEPHVRPLEFGGRRPSGFVLVDPAGYASDSALRKWIHRGLELASTMTPKPRHPAKARSKPARKRSSKS